MLYYFWISAIFFLKNGNDILMYVTHIWTFIGKFKRDGGGVGAGVSKILTCLPNRSGPYRSILGGSFLRQKCVKLKNFSSGSICTLVIEIQPSYGILGILIVNHVRNSKIFKKNFFDPF